MEEVEVLETVLEGLISASQVGLANSEPEGPQVEMLTGTIHGVPQVLVVWGVPGMLLLEIRVRTQTMAAAAAGL